MASEGRSRASEPLGFVSRVARPVLSVLSPTQRLVWTREGGLYILAWLVLLWLGLYQQINLILLVAGLAAGPVAASFFVSVRTLHRLRVTRRSPPFTFSGDPLAFDYTLENRRRRTAALALFVEDELVPADRSTSNAPALTPRVFYARVPGMERSRVRWQGVSPKRGRYRFRTLEVVTRAPFGLLERRVTRNEPGESRRWHLVQRQASETRRGQRHARSLQQQEYHGLRDYRPGDSPRWIHWRTSARLGVPMVKEFEQQNEQDLAILIDPWLPRSKVTPEQRETLERVIEFAATVCVETCRAQGRRIVLGWTAATPGVCQGPAAIKLLHELLEQLALMRSTSEGTISALFDALPAQCLRESILVLVSTRPVNLLEEAERSVRLTGTGSRGLLGRVVLLDASRGELDDLLTFDDGGSAARLSRREAATGGDETPSPATAGEPGEEDGAVNGAAVAGRGDST